MRRFFYIFIVSLLSIAAISNAFAAEPRPADGAQEPTAGERATELGTRPPVLQSMTLRYPAAELAARREAWLLLEFTVKADGSVADIVLSDGFYTPRFEKNAIKALSDAKFQPATEDGQPVDSENHVIVVFVLKNYYAATSPEVKKGYEHATEFLKQKDFEAARLLLTSLLSSNVKTLVDYAVLEELLFRVFISDGRPHEALMAIQRATKRFGSQRVERRAPLGSRISLVSAFPRRYMLVPKAMDVLFHERLALEVALRRYASARQVLYSLEELGGITKDDLNTERSIENALASDEPIVASAKLLYNGWSHTPARQIFTIANVRGQLTEISVTCPTGAVQPKGNTFVGKRIPGITFDYRPDFQWTLPPQWQDCNISFDGYVGTEFDIVELAEPAPAVSNGAISEMPVSALVGTKGTVRPTREAIVPPQFWIAPEDAKPKMQ